MKTAALSLIFPLLAFAGVAPVAGSTAKAPQRLHFHQGYAMAHGFLRGRDGEVRFVFRGLRGQRFVVREDDVINVTLPNGEKAGGKGVTDDILISETGNCVIAINQNLMADVADHPFTVKVELHGPDRAKPSH